ncbi:MAG: Ig-like domain-containing protein, partial [Lachnospiraceae bacterium]|nr:Ig-like domain-containing protein [Lachnospiraceae bacterium]
GMELSDKEAIPLNEGKTVSLKAVITPSDASNKSVLWSSNDKSVATVDKNGKVKATGYGSCEITASAADGSGASRSCIIEVSAPVKSAELSESGTINLGVGMTHEISLSRIIPYKCSPYEVEWTSDDTSVTVAPDGSNSVLITATDSGKGKARITVKITDKASNKAVLSKTLKVNVAQSQLPAGVVRIFNGKTDISGRGLSENRLPVGKKLTLKANAYENPEDKKELNSGKVKIVWDSSDPDTASVNDGKITAYKEGPVTITATVIPEEALGEGKPEPASSSCEFYIYNPVKKMQLNLYDLNGRKVKDNVKSLTVASGESFILAAAVSVEEAKGGDEIREKKKYRVNSSNEDIVNMTGSSEKGVILMPKGPGKATITISTKDGSNKSAKCSITVLGRVESLRITAKKLGNAKVEPTTEAEEITVTGLEKNKTFTIQPLINPSGVFNSNVIYRSSDPKACTVSAKGVVKRCGDGKADIFVTTVDGGLSAVCHVAD